MTLVEFMHPLKGQSLKTFCMAGLYFAQRYEQQDQLTVERLRHVLVRARVAKAKTANLAHALAQSAPYVEVQGRDGKSMLWALTPTGASKIRSVLGLPEADVEIEHDVSALDKLLSGLVDREVSNYLQEAITCLSVGALRATVVFLWEGAVREIQKKVIACPLTDVNAAIQRHDSRTRLVKKLDDFAYVKEKTLLLASEDIGLFDKAQRTTLEDALNLRNKCGHPAKYNPGPKKVSSFIEDVVGVVFR